MLQPRATTYTFIPLSLAGPENKMVGLRKKTGSVRDVLGPAALPTIALAALLCVE